MTHGEVLGDVYCVRMAGVGWVAARGVGVDEDLVGGQRDGTAGHGNHPKKRPGYFCKCEWRISKTITARDMGVGSFDRAPQTVLWIEKFRFQNSKFTVITVKFVKTCF